MWRLLSASRNLLPYPVVFQSVWLHLFESILIGCSTIFSCVDGDSYVESRPASLKGSLCDSVELHDRVDDEYITKTGQAS